MTLSWTAIESSASALGRVERVLGTASRGLRAGTLGDESLVRVLRTAGTELSDSVRVVDLVGDAASPVRQFADPLHRAGLALTEQAGFVRGAGMPADVTTLASQLDEAATQARAAAGMLRQEAHYARTAQGGVAAAPDAHAFPVQVDDLRPPSAEVQARELLDLERRAALRTPGSIADMVIYGKFGNKPVWTEYLRLMDDAKGAAATAAAKADLERAWELTVDVTERLKVIHPRERPFALSQVLADSAVAHHPASLSFPSGHTAVSWASAHVMAKHWPERAEEFLTIARRVSESRLDAGVHFGSDVDAGRVIGERVAALVLSAT